MTAEEYQQYLLTPHWRIVRSEMLRLYPKCQLCFLPYELNVHHLSYERVGTERLPDDLIVLCKSCHSRHHFLEDLSHDPSLEALLKARLEDSQLNILAQALKARLKNLQREIEVRINRRRDEEEA